MKKLDLKTSNKFRNLSFVAACLVVYRHLGVVTAHQGSSWWFLQLMPEGICQMAVPFFFLASGYFLAQHIDGRGWWRREVGKRVWSILIPYVIWCAFYVVYSMALQAMANIFAHRPFLDNVFRADEVLTWFGLDMTKMPFLTPLWFLRSLFIVVLLSPVIDYARRSLPLLVFIGMAYVIDTWIYPVFFFSIGMYLAGGKYHLSRRSGILAGVFAAVGLAFKIELALRGVAFPNWAEPVIDINLIAFFWTIVSDREWPKVLTSNAFPIYLLHWPLLFIYAAFIPNTVALGNGFQMFVKGMVGICGSLAVAVMMRKLLPGLSKYAFGGR